MRARAGRRQAGAVIAVVAVAGLLSACVPPSPPPPGPAFDWTLADLDGPGVTGGGGRTTSQVDHSNAAVTDGVGVVHNFYLAYSGAPTLTGRLRHAWNDGGGFQFEDLDGVGVAGGGGRTDHAIGIVLDALAVGSSLHVFYQDPATNQIRHAWRDGATWQFESVGLLPFYDLQLAAVSYGGELHLFYLRDDQGTPGNLFLHHAWQTASGWQFEDLDGPGVPGGNGRVSENVGTSPSAAVDGSTIHVMYSGYSGNASGAIRHGVFNGTTWTFEIASQNGDGNPFSALVWNGEVHYFTPAFSFLSHRWRDGSGWHDEFVATPLGPPGGPCESQTQHEPAPPAAAVWAGALHVWYRGSGGELCHAVRLGMDNWDHEAVDGSSAPPGNGAIAALDMFRPAVTIDGADAHVFYANDTSDRLRHAVGQQN